MTQNVQTDYLSEVFEVTRFKHNIGLTIRMAKKIMLDLPFDSIAFTGTSGAALAFILSAEMGIPLLCVRKQSENSHYVRTTGLLEGNVNTRKYLFVDDFTSSGATFDRVRKYLEEKLPKAQCVAALMYATSRSAYELDGIPFYTNVTIDDWRTAGKQLSLPNSHRWKGNPEPAQVYY